MSEVRLGKSAEFKTRIAIVTGYCIRFKSLKVSLKIELSIWLWALTRHMKRNVMSIHLFPTFRADGRFVSACSFVRFNPISLLGIVLLQNLQGDFNSLMSFELFEAS